MITVFIHVAKINHYQYIADEIFSYLVDSKLLYNSNIILYALGSEKLKIKYPESGNIKLYNHDNILDGEFITLNFLRNFALNVDSNILYLHSKGVMTKEKNEAIDDWRNYMLHFNVNEWQKCVSHLKDNDTCGVDLRNNPQIHYSGNFWWSKSSHIKKLPIVEETLSCLSNRHKCEFWLNQINGTYFSMWDSNINIYERHIHKYKKEKYINVCNIM